MVVKLILVIIIEFVGGCLIQAIRCCLINVDDWFWSFNEQIKRYFLGINDDLHHLRNYVNKTRSRKISCKRVVRFSNILISEVRTLRIYYTLYAVFKICEIAVVVPVVDLRKGLPNIGVGIPLSPLLLYYKLKFNSNSKF